MHDLLPDSEVQRFSLFSAVALSYISGGTPSTKDELLWHGDVPWTTSAPIAEDDVFLNHAERFISHRGLEQSASNLVPPESLLVGTRVGVGKAVVNRIATAISQDLTGVVLKADEVDSTFVAYQFKTHRIQSYFKSRSRGTTIKGVSRFDLERLKLWLPAIPVQKAVVQLLQAVQKAGSTRQRELALERERKAALMEYLFTHGTRGEGTTQTKIGEVPKSWQVQQLSRLAELVSGGTPSRQNALWWKGGIPWASPKDMKKLLLADTEEHVSEEAIAAGSRLVPPQTIFVVIRGMILAKNIPIALSKVPMAFNQDMKAVLPRDGHDPEFLLYALSWRKNALRRHIGTSAHGTRRLSTAAVASLELPTPPRDEQVEIALALGSCEAKINALERELPLHEEFFKALLEELMTGRLSALPLIEEHQAK